MIIMENERSLADKMGELGFGARSQLGYQEGNIIYFTKTWLQKD